MIPLMMILTLLPPITRDLSGADPGSYEDWASGCPPEGPLVITPLVLSPAGAEEIRFAVILEEGLADSLEPGTLEQWAEDMAPWTGGLMVAEASWSTPEALRSWLLEASGEGLEGVVLVGDLPVAWVMLDNAFTRDSETFPADYFLMDLDGVWLDEWVGYPSQGNPGSDGKYDTWEGELGPEIYCSRIVTSNTTVGGEAELLQAYLDRVHDWRTWGDPGPHEALCYVDDDWAGWAPEYERAMLMLYEEVECVSDVDSTCGTDYEENRLTHPYVWISPYVHSSPLLHQWSPGPSTYWNEVYSIQPTARFYNLFACSNARFTSPRNMGCIYTFATATGLASVGSTKSGSMLDFEYFYQPLGQGMMLGEAYMAWWEHVAQGGIVPWEMSWFLGMAMLGDPTLLPWAEQYGLPETAPPPASGWFRVASNPAPGILSVEAGTACTVRIYDQTGRLAVVAVSPAGGTEIDMGGLPPGAYLCRAETPGGASASGRFVLLD